MSNLCERHPVNVDFIGGEIKSSGLAFEDYSRMTTQRHKLEVGRRYEAPAWALNDDQVLAVITRSMEARAGFRKMQAGVNKERMLRAQQQLEKMRPELVSRIDRLCGRFLAAKREGADDSTVAAYGQKVEEVDTQLRLLSDIPKVLVGIIYLYWRCGYSSVDTGQHLGIKPPHVRQLLSRLLEFAAALGYAPPVVIVAPPINKQHLNHAQLDYVRESRAGLRREIRELLATMPGVLERIVALRKEGKFTVDIARELGLGANGCEIVTSLLVQAGQK